MSTFCGTFSSPILNRFLNLESVWFKTWQRCITTIRIGIFYLCNINRCLHQISRCSYVQMFINLSKFNAFILNLSFLLFVYLNIILSYLKKSEVLVKIKTRGLDLWLDCWLEDYQVIALGWLTCYYLVNDRIKFLKFGKSFKLLEYIFQKLYLVYYFFLLVYTSLQLT